MSDRTGPVAVARAAMSAVQNGQRDAWLGLFADAARVEDPVGHLPQIVGRDALAQFWDGAIASLASVSFGITREWEAGEDEAMLLATVTIVAPTGADATYDGAFNYALDKDGRIATLRAFWDLPTVAAALAA